MIVLAGPDILVQYERVGGFAGFQDRVTVDVSGAAVTNGQEITLKPGEMRDLRLALGRVVTTWSSSAGCDVPDHFAYTLTYRGHRATRCRVPPDWRAAIDRLDALTRR